MDDGVAPATIVDVEIMIGLSGDLTSAQFRAVLEYFHLRFANKKSPERFK